MSRRSFFQRASDIVDDAIYLDGKPVDPIERNKRVLAVEYKLRNGEAESTINPRATLTTISFEPPTITEHGKEEG